MFPEEIILQVLFIYWEEKLLEQNDHFVFLVIGYSSILC